MKVFLGASLILASFLGISFAQFPGSNGCPPSCATVSCPDGPQRIELDRCGCCPFGLKGFGEECAGPFRSLGNCGPSLGCVDSTGQVILPFQDADVPVGICSDRDANGNGFPGADGCPLSCAAVSCSNGFECQFGVGPSRCGCCPSCLRGPREPCAGPFLVHGFCAEGLVCLNPFLNEIITPVKEPGVPVGDCDQRRTPVDPPTEECSLNCALVRCASPESLNCKLGVGTGQCGCCPACLRGSGEPCGGAENEEGSCAYGLTCVDPYSGQPAGDQVGMCQPTRSPVDPPTEECSLNCALVRCVSPESLNCKLGVGTGQCGCCPACLRGSGEPCGGAENEEGSCAYGLTCVDPYSGQPAGDQVGVCQPTRTPVDPPKEECSLNCALVRCVSPESLNCKLGVGTGQCGCCPACLRGPGEPCGGAENEEGSCAYGLNCVDPYSGQPAGDQVGVCQPTRLGNRKSGGGESRITKGILIVHYPSLDTSDEDDVSRPHYA